MTCSIRRAREADLPAIVELLADDFLGKQREHLGPPLPDGYWAAFREISADLNARLLIAEAGSAVVGTAQLNFIRHLSRGGQRVCEIEAVFVASDRRSQGIGAALINAALAEARTAGCTRAQLTSNQQRTRAHRFYERLGFERTHFGFKLAL